MITETSKRGSRPWKKKPQLFPDWKMTPAQHRMYWNLLNRARAAYGEKITMDDFRALIHVRAFGTNVSAKDIGRMKDFDDFKAACLAIIQPADLIAQMDIEQMPKTRLIHRILNDFPASYTLQLLNSPRFAHLTNRQQPGPMRLEDMEGMSEKDLTDLRNTLCARNPVGQPSLAAGSGTVSVPVPDPSDQPDSTDAWWEQEAYKEDEVFEREESPF